MWFTQNDESMNRLLVFVTFLVISSCANSNNADVKRVQIRKMDTVLNRIIEDYPNYETNEIQREKLLKVFIRTIDSLASLNYLNDIPLEVLKIQKNPHGDGAMVQFYANNSTSEGKLLSDQLQFDFIAFMDENEAAKLNDKHRYYVSGKKIERLTQDMVNILVRVSYNSAEPTIEKTLSDDYIFNAGIFFCQVSKVNPVEPVQDK